MRAEKVGAKGRAILVVALLAVASPVFSAPAAGKFDLVCEGEDRAMGTGEVKPDSRRYTIDVTAKRWCRTAECSEAGDIEAVSADRITFRDSKPGDALEHRHWVSRVTGEYVETIFSSFLGSGSRATGKCELAPFSGFPKPKF